MIPVETAIAFEGGTPLPSREGALVTVAVSLFNYATYLDECLDSVAGQTHPHLELIVVDDRSRDDSVAVGAAWMARHEARFARTLLVSHVRNQGLSQARNTAFELARGASVFVLDADNTIYPRALARLVDTLERSGAGAAYSQLEFFGDESRLGYADIWQRDYFQRGNYVDAMALVAKEAWRRVGGYEHMEYGWEDYDFWCKFIEHEIEAVFVPETLCRYRVHGQSMLRTSTNPTVALSEQIMNTRHPWLALGE